MMSRQYLDRFVNFCY